ncbi:MAG: hypothetical protein ACREO4_03570 [Lysobacter sp.]
MSTYKPIASLTLMLGLGLTTAASAATPDIPYRWPPSVGTKPVYIHSAMPALCDRGVLYALDTWNQAGARFAFTWPSNPITPYRHTEQGTTQDRASITVEDGPMPSEHPYAQAATYKTLGTDGYIVDADIIVNRNYLFYGSNNTGAFYCAADRTSPPPSTKYDYQTVMAHELGHVIGFDEYYDDARCVTYAYLDYGDARRSLCTAEYLAFRSRYGVR